MGLLEEAAPLADLPEIKSEGGDSRRASGAMSYFRQLFHERPAAWRSATIIEPPTVGSGTYVQNQHPMSREAAAPLLHSTLPNRKRAMSSVVARSS